MKPPRQARSQKTLERILDAAEALIIERGAEALTVTEVARRARSSVGSLYARFSGKEALLRSVFERFLEQACVTAEATLDPALWGEVSHAVIVEETVAFAIRVVEERRNLIAGLTLHAVGHPDMGGLVERLGSVISDRIHTLVCRRGDSLGHPNPRQAIRFSTWVLLSTLEAYTLRRSNEQAALPSDQIATEMARMCCAYLGIVQASDEITAQSAEDDRAAMSIVGSGQRQAAR